MKFSFNNKTLQNIFDTIIQFVFSCPIKYRLAAGIHVIIFEGCFNYKLSVKVFIWWKKFKKYSFKKSLKNRF